MTLDLNLPISLLSDGARCSGILLRVQDSAHLFLLLEEQVCANSGQLTLQVADEPEILIQVHPLQHAADEGGAWTHLTEISDTSARRIDTWREWLSTQSSDTSSELAFLDRLMDGGETIDPYAMDTEDSTDTREVEDVERQSLLAALRGSMKQDQAVPEIQMPDTPSSSDWLDGLGEELGAMDLGAPERSSVSEADFEALLDEDSAALVMEPGDDDWTEDSVNWDPETEDTLLEGPAILDMKASKLAVPPTFMDNKDVPDDFEAESQPSPAQLLKARQEAELAELIGDDASTSASDEDASALAFAALVTEQPQGFSVPARAHDFDGILEASEPSEPDTPHTPSDPSFSQDSKGLHVHWSSNDSFARDYDSELSRKRLTVYGEDAPSPGSRMTVWLHLPDAQVLALSARLSGADADRFELRLDLPLVTKGKLKRVAHSD